jgi:uridine kinase
MEPRQALLAPLAARIAALRPAHPARVAIDGIDAAGKTTLADELAVALAPHGRPVIRASLDDFHRPRAERYARHGSLSSVGFYEDAFDYATLQSALLRPLGPGGGRRYRRAVFDVVANTPLPEEWLLAADDAILLFDGVFALRPELNETWDYRIFVQIPLALSLERALVRDLALHGSAETVRESYTRRYMPAQERYLATVRPMDLADAIVENTDPARPAVRFREPPPR